jgi:ParB-like chromosome segregation protein Spo0J
MHPVDVIEHFKTCRGGLRHGHRPGDGCTRCGTPLAFLNTYDDESDTVSDTTRAIDSIKIGERHRKDLGDIAGLAAIIADVGLLQPVVITPDKKLIAGERRIEAAKLLGWTQIPVRVIDLDQIVRGEFAENAYRKDFLPSEIDAIRRELEPLERARAKARQGARNDLVENCHHVAGGKTRDKIGALTGISGRQVEKIRAVMEAAEQEPERFSHIVEEMDRTGNVKRAHLAITLQRKDDERSKAFRDLVKIDSRLHVGRASVAETCSDRAALHSRTHIR